MDLSLSSQPHFENAAEGLAMSASLKKARDIGTTPKQGEFTADEGRSIYIRGYGITNSTDQKPVIGTNGMVPCIAVAVYNPKTKVGAISHFDTNTDVTSLAKLMDDVGGDKDKVEVHLAGGQLGNPHSHRLAEGLMDVIDANPNATVKSSDLMSPSGGMKSLALDTRTGETYNQFMGSQLDKGAIRNDLMTFHAITAATELPLRAEYVNGKETSLADWKADLPKPVPSAAPAVTR